MSLSTQTMQPMLKEKTRQADRGITVRISLKPIISQSTSVSSLVGYMAYEAVKIFILKIGLSSANLSKFTNVCQSGANLDSIPHAR